MNVNDKRMHMKCVIFWRWLQQSGGPKSTVKSIYEAQLLVMQLQNNNYNPMRYNGEMQSCITYRTDWPILQIWLFLVALAHWSKIFWRTVWSNRKSLNRLVRLLAWKPALYNHAFLFTAKVHWTEYNLYQSQMPEFPNQRQFHNRQFIIFRSPRDFEICFDSPISFIL